MENLMENHGDGNGDGNGESWRHVFTHGECGVKVWRALEPTSNVEELKIIKH